jgi:uncharacterized protein YbdZ (MbtH family)
VAGVHRGAPGLDDHSESDTRAECLEFINRNWTDMRPKSLIDRMKKASEVQQ